MSELGLGEMVAIRSTQSMDGVPLGTRVREEAMGETAELSSCFAQGQCIQVPPVGLATLFLLDISSDREPPDLVFKACFLWSLREVNLREMRMRFKCVADYLFGRLPGCAPANTAWWPSWWLTSFLFVSLTYFHCPPSPCPCSGLGKRT